MGIKSAISDRAQDFLMIGTLMGAILWFMFAVKYFSTEVADVIGPAGYFAIIFLGIFGAEVIIREMTNQFPFFDMLVRPSNVRYGLFIRPCDESRERKVGPNRHAVKLFLRYARDFVGFGKKDSFILHYTDEWANRIKFRPGEAFWNNISFAHPQTEVIVVSQVTKASVAIDHGEVLPVFFLENASKDHYPHMIRSDFKNNGDEKDKTLDLTELSKEQLLTHIKDLEKEEAIKDKRLAEAERQKSEWHERGVSSEEVVDQQEDEIDGLLETKMTKKETMIEELLTLIYCVAGIKNAYKHARGKKFLPWLNWWTVALIIGFSVVGIVLLSPDLSAGIAHHFSNPINQLIGVAVFVILAGIFIWSRSRGGHSR